MNPHDTDLLSPRKRTTVPTKAAALPSLGTTLSPNAEIWRAMARVGYGPTAAQIRAMQTAPHAPTWARQPMDTACAANQQNRRRA